MIGSQRLTRHVLLTCVLFHLVSIVAFSFGASGAGGAFEDGGADEKVKGSPIERVPHIGQAEPSSAKSSPQKLQAFSF